MSPFPWVTPADTARVASGAYSLSLLVAVPCLVACLGALGVRSWHADVRVGAVRVAVVVLFAIALGALVPDLWTAWVLPTALAAPLAALGKVQFTEVSGPTPNAGGLSTIFVGAYTLGIVAVSASWWRARRRLSRDVSRGALAVPPALLREFAQLVRSLGVRGSPTLVLTNGTQIPLTWGVVRPVVALPADCVRWAPDARQAALVHELSHVAAWDALYLTLARLTTVAFWFHPGAWWLARRLTRATEIARDEAVLRFGVRPSVYLKLLASVSLGAQRPTAMGLVGSSQLAERVRAIAAFHAPAGSRPSHRGVVAVATAVLCVLASTVRLAPSRHALESYLGRSQWQARAYAVTNLAQRRDSLEQARRVAISDPSPLVRATAQRALIRSATS